MGEEFVKCGHCEKETPAGSFARCPDCGMNWVCPKCKKWNRVEKRSVCAVNMPLENERNHARRYIVMMFRNSTEPLVKRIAIEYAAEFMRDDSELIAEMGIKPR